MTRAYARTSVSPSSLTRSSLGLVAILTEATVLCFELHVYLVLVLDVVTCTATGEVEADVNNVAPFFLFLLRYDRRPRESWCRDHSENLSSRVDVGWQQEQDDSGQPGRNPRCPPARARGDLVDQGQASTDQTW